MLAHYKPVDKAIDQESIIKVIPTFDTKAKLEFNLPSTGKHVSLNNTYLTFAIDLNTAEFLPDNHFAYKPFGRDPRYSLLCYFSLLYLSVDVFFNDR